MRYYILSYKLDLTYKCLNVGVSCAVPDTFLFLFVLLGMAQLPLTAWKATDCGPADLGGSRNAGSRTRERARSRFFGSARRVGDMP